MFLASRCRRAGAVLALTLGVLPLRPLTAQISLAEYAARRDSLAARIQNGVVIAFGERTPVSDFGPFYQLPAFHYLTGFDEADEAFVLVAHDGKATSTLFLTPIATRTAFYYGFRPDSAATMRLYGIQARSFGALREAVDSLAATGLPVYNLADYEDADFARQDSLTRGGQFIKALTARHAGLVVKDGQAIVNQLRAHKTPAEIALLTKAAEISSQGHHAVLSMPEPHSEYEIQAVLEYNFTRLGAERVAYGSIVGAGEDGTELHYMKDRGAAKPGDLVVIDAAGQYQGYAADVTRTVPVSGKYTADQRRIYQLVRDAQAAAERNAKAGMSPTAASDSSVEVRAKGLAAMGLIESADATYDCGQQNPCRQAQIWMIHGISHGLGLAVHDQVQSSRANPAYHVGDAFTLEPGIYISTKFLDVLPDTPRNRAFIAKVRPVAQRYNNTGVRIEDDYAITDKGLVRMSTAPREIAEIEAIMAKRPTSNK
ncbi:MAG TPA: aminopeptidase P N-terminal domain-containing protein [Gemmatimonadales bacterium]|nr:aminopeptidase P N-terminal domain-containing protein [Gemmatimonadales bacterium]